MIVCGVDEAGRGPLAGNVVAAAVILPETHAIIGINDSKKLSERKREQLFNQITTQALAYAIGECAAREIDQINILQATLLAMTRAINQLQIKPDLALIDGNKIPANLTIPAQAIIGGDATVEVISAASIIAKVTRDRQLLELDRLYPEYGFARHKGYGTPEHLANIRKHGAIPDVHRMSFAPLKTQNLF